MICRPGPRSPQWPRQRSANAEILGNWKQDEGLIWGSGPKNKTTRFFSHCYNEVVLGPTFFFAAQNKIFFDSTSWWHRSLFFFGTRLKKLDFQGSYFRHMNRGVDAKTSVPKKACPRWISSGLCWLSRFRKVGDNFEILHEVLGTFFPASNWKQNRFQLLWQPSFSLQSINCQCGGGGVRRRMFWPFGILIWYRGMLQPSQSLDLLWR